MVDLEVATLSCLEVATLSYFRVRNIYVRGLDWRLVQNWPYRGMEF
jgi:hypothetical protein